MNHFDEMAWLLYLEVETDPERIELMSAHARECAACRRLRDSLQGESTLLSAALCEEEDAIPARILNVPGRKIPAWVWTLSFASLVAGAYWAWSESVSPWLAQFSNAGFGRADLASVILFGGSLWEGWSDMMDVMQFSALVVVVVAAIALIRWHLRRSVSVAVVMVAVVLALVLPRPASAAEVRRGRSITVASGETVHNDLIAAGQSVHIDGTVEGDVIAFTKDLTVNGHVTGDVIAFSRQTVIGGTVDGNVRLAGRDNTLQGIVGKNVTALGKTLDMTEQSQVKGSVISISGEAYLDGRIGRDFLGVDGRTNLKGAIGGQMWLRGRNLEVDSTAQITGPATFHGRRQPVVAAGAQLASPIQVELTQQNRNNRKLLFRGFIRVVFRYGAALLVGILLANLFPVFFQAAMRQTEAIGLSIGVGALALMAGFFLLVTGLFLLFVGVGAGVAAALGYAPIVYVAQIFVGAWLGTRLRGNRPDASQGTIARLALGLLILHVAELIPFLGVLVRLTVLLWGTGAVLLASYKMSREVAVTAAA